MNLKKFELFIKLMKMTSSSNDGEALNALRKANSILDEVNISWEELLRNRIKIKKIEAGPNPKYARGFASGGSSAKKYTNKQEIETMFAIVLDSVPKSSSFYSFIKSLEDWWETKGFLTEKQYEKLKKAYNES